MILPDNNSNSNSNNNDNNNIIELLKTIVENGYIFSPEFHYDLLISVLELGYFSISKLLIENCPEIEIKIHKDNEYIFRLCCTHGNLDMIKWLIETYPPIDVYANERDYFNDNAFVNNPSLGQTN